MGKKQVFVDWCGIEPGYGTRWPGTTAPMFTPSGVRIAVHKPILETQPVLVPDKPWEGFGINGYATFMEDGGIIRCWYECTPAASMDDMTSLLAYAESDDGVNWRKPELGLFEFAGTKANNILKNVHGTCVFKDASAPSSQRYKLTWVQYDREPQDGNWCMICGATSPDGISWSDLPEPILVNPADTQTICGFDEDTGRYVMYTRQSRAWEKRLNSGRRAVSRSESADFHHFPKPEMVLTNDPADPPDWDYYTSGYTRWPEADNAHLMFIDMYHRTPDTFDIHLAASRDGKLWYRPNAQKPWVENGPAGSFNDKMELMTSGIIRSSGGRWAQYVTCLRTGHNDPPDEHTTPEGGYWRSLIREDGYMSLTADATGECWTTPFELGGETLLVNAVVPRSGALEIGITDAETGNPIEGYEAQSCCRLEGDALWRTINWNGNSSITGIVRRKIRLHFKLFKSNLFAYRFV